MICLYLILFIVIAHFLERYWLWAEDLFYLTVFVFFFIGMFTISDKLHYWFVGNLPYAILIFIYHPKGAYGIGMWGLFEATSYSREIVPLHILIHTIGIIIIQFGIWIIVISIKGIYRLLKRKKKRNQNKL